MAKSQKAQIQERVDNSGVMNLEGLSWRALTSFFGKDEMYTKWQPTGWNSDRKWMWFNLGKGFWQVYVRNEETKLSEVTAFCTTEHPSRIIERSEGK